MGRLNDYPASLTNNQIFLNLILNILILIKSKLNKQNKI